MSIVKDKGLILNKIKLHFKLKGNADLARFLGVAPQTISTWYARNTVDFDLIFSKCEGIDLNFLLREDWKVEEPTVVYPNKVEALPEPVTKFNLPAVVTVDSLGRNNIPLVNVRARAGYLNGYADPEYIEKLPAYNIPGTENKTFRAWEVEGHSMNPTLSNRDIVFSEWVEGLEDIREDRVHVLVTKTEGVVIKRLLNRVDKYGYIIAKSDAYNQRNEYPNIQIAPEDVQEIWYCRLRLSADFKSPTDVWHRMNNFESDLEELKRFKEEMQQLLLKK